MANRKLVCCKCQLAVANNNELETHLSVVHLEWNRFECMYCEPPAECFLAVRGEMSQHVQETHPGQPMKFFEAVDMEKLANLKEWLARSKPKPPKEKKTKTKKPSNSAEETPESEDERTNQEISEATEDDAGPSVAPDDDDAPEAELSSPVPKSPEPALPSDELEKQEPTPPVPKVPKRSSRRRPKKQEQPEKDGESSKAEETVTKRRRQTRKTTKPKQPDQEPKVKKTRQQKKKAEVNDTQAPEKPKEKDEPQLKEPVEPEQVEANEPEQEPEVIENREELIDLTDSADVVADRPFCKECKLSGSNVRAHIIQVHLGKKCVFCPHCPFADFYRPKIIKSHIRRRHPGEEVRVRDERHLHNEEIRVLKKELFGIEDPPMVTIDLE